MSKFLVGVLGGAAVAASLIGAQLAVGREAPQRSVINSAAKGDRPFGIVPITGTTVVAQSSTSGDVTVAIRSSSAPKAKQGNNAIGVKLARRPVACEAPASVLTDIAQQLQSGRCIT